MKKISFVFCFLLFLNVSNSQDYNLTFSDHITTGWTEWNGNYAIFSVPFASNYISIGRLDASDNPINRSFTTIGDGGAGMCSAIPHVDGSNSSLFGSPLSASLPDGKTLQIFNTHPSLSVYIRYWDDGDGSDGVAGGPFACNTGSTETPDYILAPGQNITIKRTGNVIAVASLAIPTLSEWGLILLSMSLSILGIIGIRQRVLA